MPIGSISIDGNKVTRRNVILRELDMQEGMMVRPDSIALLKDRNKLRLFNLQLFNEVAQEVTTLPDSTLAWHITLKERWYIIPSGTLQFADRNLNTWYVDYGHDVRRVMAGLTLTDKNFRGALERLSATVQLGYTQKVALSYMRPYLNKGQTHGLGIIASAAQSRQTYYTTSENKLVFAGSYTGPVTLRQLEGGLAYSYRPRYAARHMVQLSYKHYEVRDTIVQLNPEYYAGGSTRARFAELYYRYEYNGTDNWNYSLTGVKLVTQAVVRVGMEGIDFQSFLQAEAGWFRQLAAKWYGSAVIRGRLMYPQQQPYYFRSGLGTQTDYVRGYEYYVIDGSHYGLVRLSLKRELYNRTYATRVAYFTAIPVRLYPKVFFDAGYINSPARGNSFLSNRMLYSIGAGLDIVTLYDIKFRLEVAWNHLGRSGLYVHTNSE